VIYLTPGRILFIHSRLIDVTGGTHGVRDLGLLQSAAARPRAMFGGKSLYRDIFRKAASLFESLARNHPFIDGNKRTAIAATGVFLAMNGYRLEVSQEELERFTLSMSTGDGSVDDVAAWLKKYSRRSSGRRIP
jgi:death-on-curing protein